MSDDKNKDMDLSETVSLSETVAMEGSGQDATPFKLAPPPASAQGTPPAAAKPDKQLDEMNARIDSMGASAGFADLKKMAEQALLAAQGAFKGKRYELDSNRGRTAALSALASTKDDGLDAFAEACFDDHPLSREDLQRLRAVVLGLGRLMHDRDDAARKLIKQLAAMLGEEG